MCAEGKERFHPRALPFCRCWPPPACPCLTPRLMATATRAAVGAEQVKISDFFSEEILLSNLSVGSPNTPRAHLQPSFDSVLFCPAPAVCYGRLGTGAPGTPGGFPNGPGEPSTCAFRKTPGSSCGNSAVFRNTSFTNSYALWMSSGGAICDISSDGITVDGCTFRNNTVGTGNKAVVLSVTLS